MSVAFLSSGFSAVVCIAVPSRERDGRSTALAGQSCNSMCFQTENWKGYMLVKQIICHYLLSPEKVLSTICMYSL